MTVHALDDPTDEIRAFEQWTAMCGRMVYGAGYLDALPRLDGSMTVTRRSPSPIPPEGRTRSGLRLRPTPKGVRSTDRDSNPEQSDR